jgi:hypothetical protein
MEMNNAAVEQEDMRDTVAEWAGVSTHVFLASRAPQLCGASIMRQTFRACRKQKVEIRWRGGANG